MTRGDGVVGKLRVDMTECRGHGVCAEVAPELIALDEWGYPILADGGIPQWAAKHAKRAVTLCPRLALTISAMERQR
jgi:ferredoxin